MGADRRSEIRAVALGLHQRVALRRRSGPVTCHPPEGPLGRRRARPSLWERPARRRSVTDVVLGLVGTLAVVWLGRTMLYHARPQVQSGLIGFVVKGAHRVDAIVTVARRDRDVAATWLVRAFARDHSIVGELNFSVTSRSSTELTTTKTVRTERRATSVTMVGCRTAGQSRPR